MIAAPTRPDAVRFFTTDPQHGALLDRNGDSVPDDLRVRLIVQGEPTAADWIELIDLAARLGLETGALTLPLAVASPADLPPEVVILVFQAMGTEQPVPPGTRWVLQSAAEVRALCRADLGDGDSLPATQPAAQATAAPFDLGRLYETGGALADDDGGLVPGRVRLCPLIPPKLPLAVGLALLNFAARLGLETTGLRFPLAIPTDVPIPRDSVALAFALSGASDPAQVLLPLEPGEGRCLVAEGDGDRPLLQLHGDALGIGAVLHELAATWPMLRSWEASTPTIADIVAQLTTSLRGEDARGRAAILAADLATYAHTAASGASGELRLLLDEPALTATASAAIDAQNLPFTLAAAPDDRIAFSDEWTAEWEVDRARQVMRERVLPLLDPTAPAEITVMVSEPAAIRQSLAKEFAAHTLPAGSTVQVISAFKPGLCWLLEVVAPRWATRNDVRRIQIHYRRFDAPAGETFLDLPIRALQELYPGDELLAAQLNLPRTAITLLEAITIDSTYRAVAFDANEQQLDVLSFSRQSYHREYVAGHPEEGLVTVTTGAISATQGGRVVFAEQLPTDLDRIWDHYQQTILPQLLAVIVAETNGTIAPELQPFFEALEIEAWVSETDETLGIREELLSAAEALHQDFYFGTLDAIAALGNAAPTAGTLDGRRSNEALDAPGAIRPFVHVRPGSAPRLRVTLRRRLRHLAELAASGTNSGEPLGDLPVGKRPQIVVRWVGARAGAPGIRTVGLDVHSVDQRAAAIIRALAAQPTSANTLTLEVSIGGESISLAHPYSTTPPSPATAPASLTLPETALAEADLAPYLAQLAALPGVGVRQIGRSFEGRSLAAIELITPQDGRIWSRIKANLHKPTLLIIARHHANEPASTHAALDLAIRYATDPTRVAIRDRVNIVILPLENADGAALHAAIRQEHPTWKHHAARYNAVGREFARDYYDAETPFGEARARPRLWREWLPDVVVDNHGVPSHEWNQHFNGFGSPPRFGVSYWLVSALLYGILRYPTADPAHAAFAEAARDRIAAAVAADAEIFAANQQIRDSYERWGHQRLPERFPATYHREMLWYFGPQSAEARARFSRPDGYDRVTVADIVTEVPDETAQGDYLALVAHAHIVANEVLLALLADLAPAVERTVTATPTGPWLRLHRQRPLRPGE